MRDVGLEGETGERDGERADVKDLERGYKRIFGNGADEDVEEIGRDPDQENGQRKIKKMLDPKLPTAEEVRQHDITHMPYRNWCPHCVRGRGEERD